MFWKTALLISCVKALLIPIYHSTDFEVHRNWLAITHSLPLKEWYYESTSIWTLDYPPLFAWMEFGLSYLAKYFDSNMLIVENLNYSSEKTILFQRLSVIISDIVLIFSCKKYCSNISKDLNRQQTFIILLLCNVGLLMVDHIHFQYNGILFGILLLSISYIVQNKPLKGAFLFCVLLNMKHIFIYMAPAYFIYLLRYYCFPSSNQKLGLQWKTFSVRNFLKLAAIVLIIFFVTYLPFYNHIPQILSRLFPFKRGLCHAYWAPNIWAIYTFVDKIALLLGKKLGFQFDQHVASMTGGLIGEFPHFVLPSIKPIVTLCCTLVLLLPVMMGVWYSNKETRIKSFIKSIILSAAISFLCGWHVHEKAILMVIIPLSILAVNEKESASYFLILTTIGHYSLFPLLYPLYILPIKLLLFTIYTISSYVLLSRVTSVKRTRYCLPLLNIQETVYILLLIPLFIFTNIIYNIIGFDKILPFLPLMLTSVYCAIGVIYSFIGYYVHFINKTLL